jgi:hypothetical protein
MSTGPSGPDDVLPFAAFWSSCLGQADLQTRALFECFKAMGDPKQLQRQWLDTLSRTLDSYMRSPAFLETMQKNLKAMTDLKALQDQMVQDAARHVGAPLASDVQGLFERLHSVEQTMLGQLQAIEQRLAAIEARLDSERNTR